MNSDASSKADVSESTQDSVTVSEREDSLRRRLAFTEHALEDAEARVGLVERVFSKHIWSFKSSHADAARHYRMQSDHLAQVEEACRKETEAYSQLHCEQAEADRKRSLAIIDLHLQFKEVEECARTLESELQAVKRSLQKQTQVHLQLQDALSQTISSLLQLVQPHDSDT